MEMVALIAGPARGPGPAGLPWAASSVDQLESPNPARGEQDKPRAGDGSLRFLSDH